MFGNVTRLIVLSILLIEFDSSAASASTTRPATTGKVETQAGATRNRVTRREHPSRSGGVVDARGTTAPEREVNFLPVVYASLFNSAVNVLRPDSSIPWQARVPRVIWELCIARVAVSANESNPPLCLLLSLMMIPTALMDIFIWAPSFALFADFETCTGGGFWTRDPRVCVDDYAKGFGRLFVSVQSLLTGVLYLFAAVVSWTIFAESRDASVARKNAIALAELR